MGKFGFAKPSWKRALGISAAKGKISRAIGVPLTKSGRERKFGRVGAKFLWPFGIASAGMLKAKRPADSGNVQDCQECVGDSPFYVAKTKPGIVGRLALLVWSLVILLAAIVVGIAAYAAYVNKYGLFGMLLGLIAFWLLIRAWRNLKASG